MRFVVGAVALLALSGCIQEPSLFIRLTGDGAGRVESDPAGINCGTACGMIVPGDVHPTLTATPRSGSAFEGWRGGGCSGIEPCTPTLLVNTTVEARFTVAVRRLTVARMGTGHGTVTSSPGGILCGTDCTEAYAYNTELELSAVPDDGSRFLGWLGEDECTSTSPCVMTLDRDATIGALFEPL
jgi:hypothetical protein